MTLADVRSALRSDEPNVLVEAPAGCGKTFEAADLAVEIGTQLIEGAQVLVLAHTNAAVQEFLRRVRGTGARVRATTVDSFCVELLDPYAGPLGLPMPLRRNVGLGSNRIAFSALAPTSVNLLSRCPSIRTMLAHRYPFVILDEHQDANLGQHEVVSSFREMGSCRVRVFGDPMQAIFEATDAEAISWDRLSSEAGKIVSLDTAQRWRQQPELGDWILHARGELRAGRTLPLQTAPSSVTVKYLPNVACVGFGRGNAGALVRPVQEFVRNAVGSAAILSRHNNHVWGLHIAAAGQLRLNEGSEFSDAYELLEKAAAELGNAKPMAVCLIEHVHRVSTGMDHAKCDSILASLQDDCINCGRRQVVKPFLAHFERLYQRPDLSTFCEVAKAIVTAPPPWLTIRMPVSMRLLGQVHPMPGDDPIECLDEVVARIKTGARKLSRSVSTIHKAKGLEFESVLIGNFSAAHFGDDELSRKLAYVALSRAQRAITILVPGNNPSPLVADKHA